MSDTDGYDQAMRSALARLGRRGLSRRQLGDKLQQDGYNDELCRQVLDRLVELGLIDDEALGRFLISQLCRRQPAGPRLIESKLLQHGIDPQVVEQLVEANSQPGKTLEQARELVRSQRPAIENLDDDKRRRKLWALLARRGYDADTIDAALGQQISEV